MQVVAVIQQEVVSAIHETVFGGWDSFYAVHVRAEGFDALFIGCKRIPRTRLHLRYVIMEKIVRPAEEQPFNVHHLRITSGITREVTVSFFRMVRAVSST